MSPFSHTFADSGTMLRRDFRHSLRNPMTTISGLMVPIVFLLLFVGVFGHAFGGELSDGTKYINYLAPGIILMTVGASAAATAINVCMDMNEGIIGRFRTMAISRTSVLTGQVVGSLIRTLLSGVLVIGVALLLGFRPTAGPVEWVGAAGVFAMLTLALTWLTVAFGLLSKTPAGANSLSLIPEFLPFISSAFLPPASMPASVRWFAQNQPFTPVIDTLRGLLTGGPIGDRAVLAAVWCGVLALVGYLWARKLYDRDPGR